MRHLLKATLSGCSCRVNTQLHGEGFSDGMYFRRQTRPVHSLLIIPCFSNSFHNRLCSSCVSVWTAAMNISRLLHSSICSIITQVSAIAKFTPLNFLLRVLWLAFACCVSIQVRFQHIYDAAKFCGCQFASQFYHLAGNRVKIFICHFKKLLLAVGRGRVI